MRKGHGISGKRRGAALVEFAILLPLFLFLIAVGVDFARIFYHLLTVTNCARNGAIYASASSDKAVDTAGISAAALSDASNLSPAPTVTSALGTDETGHPCVSVTVSWEFHSVTRLPGIPSGVTLSRSVQMRVAPQVPKNS